MQAQAVAGDALLPLLEAKAPVGPLRIDPPPRSWAALKPDLLRLAARARTGGARLPPIEGYPACAVGSEYREIPAARPDAPRFFEPCEPCGRQVVCSPPAAWSDELVPFAPDIAPFALWTRFHRRLNDVLRTPYRQDLDALVARHLAARAAPLAGAPLLFEPSLSFGAAGLLPLLRLGIFNGPLPAAPEAARRASLALLDSFAELHDLVSAPQPVDVLTALRDHLPLPLPLGFESGPDGPILLKAWAQLWGVPPDRRRALGESLRALAGSDAAALPPVDWGQVDMIGVGTLGGTLRSLKLYVTADPAAGWAAAGLPAVPADDPLMRLSGGQAYAVLDLRAVAPRPPKWDFALRRQLLAGRLLVDALGPALPVTGRAQLERLVLHGDFRTDAIAAALRGGRLTIYGELG